MFILMHMQIAILVSAMSQTDVFRPSDDNIALRGNLAHGLGESADVFRKPNPSSKPPSRSSSRFGKLSFNSFFARHNPHPGRVRHLKGSDSVDILQDVL